MRHAHAAAILALLTVSACSSGGGSSSSSSTSSGAGGGASSGSSTTGSSSSSTGGGGAGGNPGAASGTIVPLYSYPTDASWKAIVAAKQMHPTVAVRAIINPDSGPGASVDPTFQTGIAALDAAGIVVLGYVATTYAQKPAAAAQVEIDAYKGFYAGVRGIMFDEMSNTPGDEAYYQGLDQYAKSKGLAVTVGNPGSDVPETFIGAVDTIFVYESGGLPDLSKVPSYYAQHAREGFGVIPYAVPALDAAFVASARKQVGFIYLTDDDLPNPWDTLPPYFAGLLAALE
jgi:hypothetical protein